MAKVIIFDTDGMMVNSEMFNIQHSRKFSIPIDEMLPFFKGIFQDCLTGKADLKKVIIPWLKKWKWAGTADELLSWWFRAEHNIDQNLVREIKILKNKGIKCYLATNQEKYRTEYMKKQMGFENLFDKIFSSAEISHKKPQKEFFEIIYKKIIKDALVKKDEIMFWDDERKNIERAKELGFNAHLYKNFENFLNKIN